MTENWVAVLATVSNFVGIILMVAYGLPKLRDDRPLDEHWVGIVGLLLFTLGTAIRIVTLIIPVG